MKKEAIITHLLFLVALVFLLSTFFDFFSTYLLFKDDYSRTMGNEVNREIIQQVQKYGILGALIPSTQQIVNWLLFAILGGFLVSRFFFDEFKEEYQLLEKLTLCSCLSFLLISSLHLGAGLVNLIGLLWRHL